MVKINIPPPALTLRTHLYAYVSKKVLKQIKSAAKQNKVSAGRAITVAWEDYHRCRRSERADYIKSVKSKTKKERAHFYLDMPVSYQMHAEATRFDTPLGTALEAAWNRFVLTHAIKKADAE